MSNLTTKIKLYCNANGISKVDFFKDIIVRDFSDGTGAKIDEWNLDIPKPTAEQLATYESAATTEENNNTIRATRRTAYGNIGDQLDVLYKDMLADKGDKSGEWFKAIKAVKDANPKE